VDLQERYQLDAPHLQVAKEKVKVKARPWRYIFALMLALIAAIVSVQARHVAAALAIADTRGVTPQSLGLLQPLGHNGNVVLSYGAAVAFCLLASAAVIGVGNKARGGLQESIGSAHAAVIRFTIVLAGGLATIVLTLQLLNIPITQLVVGGALTGVLVGIAAQQSLANVFAGIVLLMARPFRVGDQIGIRSGALGGLIEGFVTEISITYVMLDTGNGAVHVPNSQVLAAAVGPAGSVAAPPGATPWPAPAGQAAPAGTAPAPPAGQGAPPGPGEAPPAGQAAPPAGPSADLPPGTPGTPTDPAGPAAPQDPDARGAERDTGR
jgi:Mechanosensitive ion channel, beta-domain